MVEQLLLQQCYSVVQLSFKSFQKLLAGPVRLDPNPTLSDLNLTLGAHTGS
jgi:hypothetical protein